LFGLTGIDENANRVMREPAPKLDLQDVEATKSAVGEVVRLALVRAQYEENESSNQTVTLREAMRPARTAPEPEITLTDLERAKEYVEGVEGRSAKSLVKVVNAMVNQRRAEAEMQHSVRINVLPDSRGILGQLGGAILGKYHVPFEYDLAMEAQFHEAEMAHINGVSNFVIDNSDASWGAQPQQEQAPVNAF